MTPLPGRGYKRMFRQYQS